MPYHSIRKLLAYGPEQGMLHRYLQEGFDPYDYSYELEDWLLEHVCEECDAGDDPDCEKCKGEMKAKVGEATGGDDSLAWIDGASDADLARFREHVESRVQRGDMGPDRPAYEHMSFNRLVKPTWLVHFTDDPESIASDGFTHGWDSTEGLGLTTHFSDEARKRGPGFNFAFVLGSRDAKNAARSDWRSSGPKYGKHAVVFWAGGVEAYHYGDEEDQVIFWGLEVGQDRIFAMRNGDDGWWVDDATGRTVFGIDQGAPYDDRAEAKGFEETAEWIVSNHRMLSGTDEKADRRRRELAKVARRDNPGEILCRQPDNA